MWKVAHPSPLLRCGLNSVGCGKSNFAGEKPNKYYLSQGVKVNRKSDKNINSMYPQHDVMNGIPLSFSPKTHNPSLIMRTLV